MKTMTKHIVGAFFATAGLSLFAGTANAGMVTDGHGNVGYDTYDECVAAVKNGTAKFYTPYTHYNPKRMRGETSVKSMRLKEVNIPFAIADQMPLQTREYTAGACDRGVGQSHGRYGVSGELVGKYVPFSPDMMVNVYMDGAGNPVRVSMKQCDNHFGGKFPTPVISELKAPPAQLKISEDRDMEVVTTSVKRVVRPSKYTVKEVIVAPASQVKRIATQDGTAVAVQNTRNSAVVVGQRVDEDVLDQVDQPVEVPVTVVPDIDNRRVVIEQSD